MADIGGNGVSHLTRGPVSLRCVSIACANLAILDRVPILISSHVVYRLKLRQSDRGNRSFSDQASLIALGCEVSKTTVDNLLLWNRDSLAECLVLKSD